MPSIAILSLSKWPEHCARVRKVCIRVYMVERRASRTPQAPPSKQRGNASRAGPPIEILGRLGKANFLRPG